MCHRAVALSLAAIFSPAVLFAQTSNPANSSNSPPQRDPQAITILTQALNTAGGASALSAIQDFTATGSITYYWGEGPVQGAATIKGRGLHEFRLDATLADGVHSWIVNNSSSYKKNPDSSTSPLPSQNIVKAANTIFPLFQVFTAVQDTAVGISYGGLVTHNGQQVHDVVVQRTFPQSTHPVGSMGPVTKAHIFIDPNALTIQSVADAAYRSDGGPGEFSHEMDFSSYQTANGVLLPFNVKELIGGQQTMTVQLSQISFNSGLSEADFD